MIALPLAAVFLLVLAVGSEEAKGRTLTVDDDGTADYLKIQDAIDNATKGDTIRVQEGTYYENVVVDKTVNLIGDGAGVTIIDAPGKDNAVNITANWVNMSNFTVNRLSPRSRGISEVYMRVYAGIKIESDNNQISNIVCQNHRPGIYLFYADNNTLTNNTCSHNSGDGIVVWVGKHNTLINNSCNFNSENGIYIEGYYHRSSYTTLIDNTCSLNSDDGIYLRDSDHVIFTNNACIDNENHGITLRSSRYCTLTGNWLNGNSIYILPSAYLDYKYDVLPYLPADEFPLDDWNTHFIDSSNTVNWRPVYYYKNATEGRVPANAGQVILSNCSSMIVENQELTHASLGISLYYSFDIIVANNTCSRNNEDGILLWWSHHITLLNNTCSHNGDNGIHFFNSNSSIISSTACSYNILNGILFIDSYDNTISSTTCSYNDLNGIEFSKSYYNTLIDNTCSHNFYSGIILSSFSSENTIRDNTCSDNRYGISLQSSNRNEIINNTISNNCFHGIYVFDALDNVALYNRIYGNSYGIRAQENPKGVGIKATKNWWGDVSGPYHGIKNPDGKGDRVYGEVEFEPWLERDDIYPPEEKDDNDADPLGRNMLLAIAALLVILLAAVIRLPSKRFK